jgi:HD-like signal output (HDOD) protein
MNDFQLTRQRYSEKIQAYVARMPSLSTTVVKVLKTCNDPGASANDLKRVISLDPVLTGRVLKLINSAYYSPGNPISSLTRAIIMLGVNTVKNLALSFSIIDHFKGRSACLSFSTDEFWRHSLCVGVVAKSLAAVIGIPETEQEAYFIGGLLHDLGKLPLYMQFPAEYYHVCETVDRRREALYQNEARCLGVDHEAVGNLIAKKWCLGPPLVQSLACHHRPEDASAANRRMVSVVAAANQLALKFNIGNAGDHPAENSKIDALIDGLGVDGSFVDNTRETVSDEIERAKFFLEIAQDG